MIRPASPATGGRSGPGPFASLMISLPDSVHSETTRSAVTQLREGFWHAGDRCPIVGDDYNLDLPGRQGGPQPYHPALRGPDYLEGTISEFVMGQVPVAVQPVQVRPIHEVDRFAPAARCRRPAQQ